MSKRVKKKENISYTLSESEKEEENVDINQLMEEFEGINVKTPESGVNDDDERGEELRCLALEELQAEDLQARNRVLLCRWSLVRVAVVVLVYRQVHEAPHDDYVDEAECHK